MATTRTKKGNLPSPPFSSPSPRILYLVPIVSFLATSLSKTPPPQRPALSLARTVTTTVIPLAQSSRSQKWWQQGDKESARYEKQKEGKNKQKRKKLTMLFPYSL